MTDRVAVLTGGTMFDELLGETLTPARVDYTAARPQWEAWFDAHPAPTNGALDARLADAGTRVGFVPVCRARGYFHLPTAEFVAALAGALRRLPGPYLEVGAGQGALARAVRAVGVPLIAADDGAWWPDALPPDVARMDVQTALTHHAPGTALVVWPPRNTHWPALFRATGSVCAYLIIGEGAGGMTGDDAAWAEAAGWSRTWLPDLAALGRCRLDADGTHHTRVLLVRRNINAFTAEAQRAQREDKESCL